jgi:hypothetical protein
MALFGRQRDISLFTTITRELMGDVITQQIAYYKLKLDETISNIYGEAANGKFYYEPVLLNCIIERGNQEFPESDLGVDFTWTVDFKFLREDLIEASVVPEVGDIIMYYDNYYEVDDTDTNQYLLGKNPSYNYAQNPLNPGLEQFGANYSIICKTHVVPADKVEITKERF